MMATSNEKSELDVVTQEVKEAYEKSDHVRDDEVFATLLLWVSVVAQLRIDLKATPNRDLTLDFIRREAVGVAALAIRIALNPEDTKGDVRLLNFAMDLGVLADDLLTGYDITDSLNALESRIKETREFKKERS